MNSVRKEGRRRPVKEKEIECEWVHWFELANGRSQWRVFKVTETSSIHADNFFAVAGTLQERSYNTLVMVGSSHTKGFDFHRDAGVGSSTVKHLRGTAPSYLYTRGSQNLLDH
jgi:hypothetical protein